MNKKHSNGSKNPFDGSVFFLKTGGALVFCLCVVQLLFLLVLPFSVSCCIFSDGGMFVFTHFFA